MKTIPVEDHPELVRDLRTGAILNIDSNAARAAKLQRALPERVAKLEETLDQQSLMLNDIKALLIQLAK